MSIEKIPLVPGVIELVSSIDELNYQEVIKDFPNAEFIFITTYNISEKKNNLLNLIKEASSHAEVHVITNIPKRFEEYYGYHYQKNAKKSIENYTKKLNPNNFDNFSNFFHLENHSKIILTNNIAYIGSANFSEESKKSRETGILILDSSMIQNIIDHLIPILKEESIQFFDDKLNQKIITFSVFASELKATIEIINEGLYSYVGYPIEDTKVYCSWNPHLPTNFASDLFDTLINIEEELDEIRKVKGLHTNYILSVNKSLKTAQKLCDDRTPIQKLSQFNPQDVAMDLMQEELLITYDNIDKAAEIASNKAYQKFEQLAESAEQSVEELLTSLNNLLNDIGTIISELKSLVTQQETIDNTDI